MKAVVQRVSQASVSVDGKTVGEIAEGILVLLGVAKDDTTEDIEYLVRKLVKLRLFEDEQGLMNLSLLDKGAQVLCVSQFTLLASMKKGNRPSFSLAAPPEVAKPLFDQFVHTLGQALNQAIPTGVFGAHMKVSLLNDGPVTLLFDTKSPV